MDAIALRALAVLVLLAGILMSLNETVRLAWNVGLYGAAVGHFLGGFLVAALIALALWTTGSVLKRRRR